MAFPTHNPDINSHIVRLFAPKDFLHYGMTDKHGYNLVRTCPIYTELLRLRFDKHSYRFDSYDIIRYYYVHGMINLIAQHQFDYYQGVVVAAKYGHLDLLKLIYQADSLPLAKYIFTCHKTISSVIQIANQNKQYHILKWFTHVGIIDHWLTPSKIYHKPINSFIQKQMLTHISCDASASGNISLLQELNTAHSVCIFNWSIILSTAFEHGQLTVLEWLSDMILPNLPCPGTGRPKKPFTVLLTLILPGGLHANVTTLLLNWYEKHKQNFPNYLYLTFNQICRYGQIDILERYYPMVPSSIYYGLLRNIIFGGNLDAVEWLYHKDEQKFTDHLKNIVEWSIEQSHLHLWEWLRTKFPHISDTESIMELAISQGNVVLLDWLWNKAVRITLTVENIITATYFGYIHILAWLEEHQLLSPNLIEPIIKIAIEGNHIQIIKWVGEQQLKELTETIPTLVALAITNNRVEILDLFHQYQMITHDMIHNFMFSYHNKEYELIGDTYTMLRWIKERYASFDILAFLNDSLAQNEWHIVEWITEHHPDVSGAKLSDKLKTKLLAYQQYRQQKIEHHIY